MKKQFAVFAAIAFASVSFMHAQDASSQDASAIPESPDQESLEPSEGVLIEEPSGAEVEVEVPAPSPTPPDFPELPVDPTAAATESQTNVTITISQTFTNAPNAITIVGSVSSQEEKQNVEQALQEVLPDKQINNHLTVSAQQIEEPAGAESPQDEPEREEQENEEDESEVEIDVEREFELQDQNSSQSEP
ncbi:MAG: hypothetical protein H0X66_08855 [Verrucomicrobia bacterium]|nr:hypothetical protein [Verrucomicrobiota bacterium]